MPFTGIAYPHQLAVLTEALEKHCEEFGIQPKSQAYYDAGRLAIVLFEGGSATFEELTVALRQSVAAKEGPKGRRIVREDRAPEAARNVWSTTEGVFDYAGPSAAASGPAKGCS